MLWQAGRGRTPSPPSSGRSARASIVFCRDVCAPRRVTAVHFLQGYSICVFEYILGSEKGTHTPQSVSLRRAYVRACSRVPCRARVCTGACAARVSNVTCFKTTFTQKKGTHGAHMQPRGPRPDHIIRHKKSPAELADVSHGQLRGAPQQLSCTGPAAAAPPWRPHPARRRPRPQRGKAWRGAVAPTCAFRGWA